MIKKQGTILWTENSKFKERYYKKIYPIKKKTSLKGDKYYQRR